MTLTEQELFDQYPALQKTFNEFDSNSGLSAFLRQVKGCRIIFIGSGSSFTLSKAAAYVGESYTPGRFFALTAGDMLINHEDYSQILDDALLIVLSRSGSTSEVVKAVEIACREYGSRCLSVTAIGGAPVSGLSDLNIVLPWIYDESVCQTRCIVNLYAAALKLIAVIADSDELHESLLRIMETGPGVLSQTDSMAKKISEKPWERAVVLVDGKFSPLSATGALAFQEIAGLNGEHAGVLDYRHGPIVMLDEKTLVIAAFHRKSRYYDGMIRDLSEKTKHLIVVSSEKPEGWGGAYIEFPVLSAPEAAGIVFLAVAQLTALRKADSMGINPDSPDGLSAWVDLDR